MTGALATLAPIVERVRTDVTAVRKANGVQAWTREALTPARLAKHLNGGPARGVCPIKAGESTTRVAVLDLDSHGGETSWPDMCRVAAGIVDALALVGLYAQPFRSTGGRGLHLYMLWDTPQDARSVRLLLADVLAGCGLKPGVRGVGAGEVEIFPKQDSVPADGFGSQFILPLAGKSVPLAGLGVA
jgi:hypothetical protein